MLSLVQDEPALARRCRERHPGPDLRAALCRRQVGSEEWSSKSHQGMESETWMWTGNIQCHDNKRGQSRTSLEMADISNWSSASAGVFQASVLRGLKLSAAATAAIASALCVLRSVPFGKYWRSSPLVFSLVPRCHGL